MSSYYKLSNFNPQIETICYKKISTLCQAMLRYEHSTLWGNMLLEISTQDVSYNTSSYIISYKHSTHGNNI